MRKLRRFYLATLATLATLVLWPSSAPAQNTWEPHTLNQHFQGLVAFDDTLKLGPTASFKQAVNGAFASLDFIMGAPATAPSFQVQGDIDYPTYFNISAPTNYATRFTFRENLTQNFRLINDTSADTWYIQSNSCDGLGTDCDLLKFTYGDSTATFYAGVATDGLTPGGSGLVTSRATVGDGTAPSTAQYLLIQNTAINQASVIRGLWVQLQKDAGATSANDNMFGIQSLVDHNDAGQPIGTIYGTLIQGRLSRGAVGTMLSTQHFYGAYLHADNNGTSADTVYGVQRGVYALASLDAGADVEGVVEGVSIFVDLNSGTVDNDVHGLEVRVDNDATVTGKVYAIHWQEDTGVDSGLVQVGTAPSRFGGAVKIDGALTVASCSGCGGGSGAYDLDGGALTIDTDGDTYLQEIADDITGVYPGGNQTLIVRQGAIEVSRRGVDTGYPSFVMLNDPQYLATGMGGYSTTDITDSTFFFVTKADYDQGGAALYAVQEDASTGSPTMQLAAYGGTGQTVITTEGLMHFRVAETNGLGALDAVLEDAGAYSWSVYTDDSGGDAWENYMWLNEDGRLLLMNDAEAALIIGRDDYDLGLNFQRGVWIDQETDDEWLFVMSSDNVSHGINTNTTPDLGSGSGNNVFHNMRVSNSGGGGLYFGTYAENDSITNVLEFVTYGGIADTTQTTSSNALVMHKIYMHNGGATRRAINDSGNVWGVSVSDGAASFRTAALLNEDGNLWLTTSPNTFDAYGDGDPDLLAAYDMAVAPGQVIQTEWEDFLRYNEADLVAARILGAPLAEGGLTNVTQLQKLQTGTIRWNTRAVRANGYADSLRDLEVARHDARLFAMERSLDSLRMSNRALQAKLAKLTTQKGRL